MKTFRLACSLIIGSVFMFSGIVKAIDPLGSAYKFHDYFHAFNLGFLDSLSLPLGILLCTIEFAAGFSVTTGIRQKAGLWIVLLLMLIFTPLTFVLALTNPVSDCGCFGDAIHLTNWQTFWKNILLIILITIVFTGRKNITSLFKTSIEYIIIAIVSFTLILFCTGNLRYLPIIDFLPYKTGVRIADQMVIPEGAEPDKYVTTFIYEKNGEQKEFTLENYPASDTTWRFIDQKTVLVKKGYLPPIHDFRITQINGDDITGKILSEKGYSVLMITKKLSDADTLLLSQGFDLGIQLTENGIGYYVVTASPTEEVQKYNNGLIFCSADETTLKTMIRANPGYMLIRDGIIEAKWSWGTIPPKEWFSSLLSGTYDRNTVKSTGTFTVLTLITSLLLILCILGFNIKKYYYFSWSRKLSGGVNKLIF
jgi:hypothetical protein